MRIVTRCPSCRAQSLFIGEGGHLTCSVIGCKNPSPESVWEEMSRLIGTARAERDEYMRERDEAIGILMTVMKLAEGTREHAALFKVVREFCARKRQT